MSQTVPRSERRPAPEAALRPSPPATSRPRLRRALAGAARDFWDYAGSFLLGGALWALLAATLLAGLGRALVRLEGLLPALAAASGFAVLAALLLGPLTGGLFRLARNAAAREDVDPLDLLWGTREAFGRCARLAGAQLAIGGALAADLLIVFVWGAGDGPLAGFRWLTGLFVFSLAAWVLLCGYQWALLVEQGVGARTAIRRSCLLLLGEPLFGLRLGAALALLALVLGVSVVGAALGAGLLAAVATQGTRELLRRYGLLPAAGESSVAA